MFHRKAVRILVVIWAVVLIVCNVSASAADHRASLKIGYATATLSKDRYGDLSIACHIKANGVMDTIGVSSIRIERYNGSKWIREGTLTDNDLPGLLTSNRLLYDVAVSYSPQYSDVSYRAVVSFYAEDSDGVSTKSVTTKSV